MSPSKVERFLSGDLQSSELASVQGHINGCNSCRDAVGQEELFKDLQDAFQLDEFRFTVQQAGGATAPPLTAYDEVADGYAVLGEIHRGGQGIVYRVKQQATNRVVALKVLLAGGDASEQQKWRFDREINIAASLRHRNIVTIYDSGTHNELRYLAMEYIDGQPLDSFVRDHHPAASPTYFQRQRPLEQTLELFCKILDAISYAHSKGVIHRDLKPGNVIVDERGEPHILDFGLAKYIETENLLNANSPTLCGEFLGTIAYASPEQTRGSPIDIDVRTDVYSLGVILYEILTGKLPYRIAGPIPEAITNICETLPGLPSKASACVDSELETILLKALAKEPARRYQSVQEFRQDIKHYIAHEPIDAKRDSTWYLVTKSLKKNRLPITIAAAFSLVVLVALFTSLAALRNAVNERNLAISANSVAQTARSAERQQHEVAESHRREAEFQSYVANLAAAAGAIRMHDIVEASSRLGATAPHLRGWEWHQLMQELDTSTTTLTGHSSYVTDVALCPNSEIAAASGYDHVVRLWNTATGDLLSEITGPARATIAFSPDGAYLAIGWWNGNVRFWDITKQAYSPDHDFRGSSSGIDSLAFSADGLRFAASFHPTSPDQPAASVEVWSLVDSAQIRKFDSDQWNFEDLALDADGTTLATISFDGARIWDVESGKTRFHLPDQPGTETSVALSPDGATLATGGADNTIHLWDVTTGNESRQLLGHTGAVLSLAYSADGLELVSGSRDKTLRLWTLDQTVAPRVFTGHRWAVTSVAIQSETLISGSWDSEVKVWVMSNQQHSGTISAHSAKITCIHFQSSGQSFATAAWDKSVKIWNTSSGAEIAKFVGHTSNVHCVAFSPDGLQLVSGGWNGELKMWDVAAQTLTQDLVGHDADARIHSVAFSPDGSWFVSASSHNELLIWDTETGRQVASLVGHDDHIHAVVVSHDGKRIVSAGHWTVKVWDADTRSEIASFHRRMIQDDYSLAIHPNSKWVAAGTDLSQMTVFNIETAEVVKRLTGHTDEINAAVFSPDGARLVSAALDNRVKIWDPQSGRELGTLYGISGHVNHMAFSPDGHYLVAGLDSGDLKIWRGGRMEGPQSRPEARETTLQEEVSLPIHAN